MLLLLAIALVLIGVVTLVIGIISNTLAWVFISIGATVAAGIVLYILYRLGRKQAAAAATAPAPEAAPSAPPAPVVPAPTAIPPAAEPRSGDDRFAPAGATSTGGSAATATRDLAAPTENLRSTGATVDESDGDFEDEDDLFPIAEYEELRVAEILPLLPELDAEELEVVREREASTKARATILNRIDELAPNALGGWSDGDRGDDAPTDVASSPRPAPAAASGRRAAAAGSPIAGYDDLKVAEILPILTRLGTADLEAVADQERRGPNRQTILNRIEGRLRFLEGQDAAAPTTSAPRRGRGPATPTPTALPTAGRRATSATKARGGSRATASTKAAPVRRTATASAPSASAPAVPAKRGRPRKDPGSGLPVPASLAPTATKTTRAPRATSATKATRATKATAKKTTAAKAVAAPRRSPRSGSR